MSDDPTQEPNYLWSSPHDLEEGKKAYSPETMARIEKSLPLCIHCGNLATHTLSIDIDIPDIWACAEHKSLVAAVLMGPDDELSRKIRKGWEKRSTPKD